MAFIKNPLFYFISKGTYRPEEFDPKPDAMYYRLPPTNIDFKLNDENYIVTEQHISFFEKQDDSDPLLTQYHYTASLKNQKTNEIVKIRVFLKQNDEVAGAKIGSPPKDIEGDVRATIIQHAITMSMNIMPELRREAQMSFESDVAQYQTQEARLSELSKDHAFESLEYQTQLETTVNAVSALIPFDQEYAAIHQLFTFMKPAASKPRPLVKPQTDELEDKIDIISAIEDDNRQVNNSPLSDLTDSIQQIKETKSLLAKAREAKQSLEKIVPIVVDYFNQTTETTILLDINDSALTPAMVNELRLLKKDSNREAITILQNLLINAKTKEDFNVACKLSSLTSQLPKSMIGFAFRKDNGKLLDFLLTYGRFAVNTMLIDGLSPVLRCLRREGDEAYKITCLSVLIKHNASLMIPAADGLPVAHHILSRFGHPCMQAFIDNPEKTISNRSFLKILQSIVIKQLTITSLDERTRSRLQMTRGHCEEYLSNLNSLGSNNATAPLNTSIATIHTALAGSMTESNHNSLQSILEDLDITKLRTKVRIAYETAVRTMSRENQRIVVKRTRDLEKEIETIASDQGKSLSPMFKRNMIELLELHLKFAETLTQLNILSEQAKLYSGLSRGKKEVKKHNSLVAENDAKLNKLKNDIHRMMANNFYDNDTKNDDNANSRYLAREDKIKLIINSVIAIKSLERVKSKDLKLKITSAAQNHIDTLALEDELVEFNDDEISQILLSIGTTLTKEKNLAAEISALDKIDILNFATQRVLHGEVNIFTKINGNKSFVGLRIDENRTRLTHDEFNPVRCAAKLTIQKVDYPDKSDALFGEDDDLDETIVVARKLLDEKRSDARTEKVITGFGLENFVADLEALNNKGMRKS